MGSACIKGERENRARSQRQEESNVELSEQQASSSQRAQAAEPSAATEATSGKGGSELTSSAPERDDAKPEARQSSAHVSAVEVEMADPGPSHVVIVMGASVSCCILLAGLARRKQISLKGQG